MKFGSSDISAIKFGGANVSAIYFGSTQVWSAGPPLVSLLLNFDGDFTDSSPNSLTLTPNGDLSIDTTEKKFGSGSGLFNDPTKFLTADIPSDFIPASSDFTIEMWVYRIGNPYDYETLFVFYRGETSPFVGGEGDFFGLFLQDGSRQLMTFARFGGDFGYPIPGFGNSSVPIGEWAHVAIVRNAGYLSTFINGVPNEISGGPLTVALGEHLVIGGINSINAYIDGLRITNAALYCGAGFTPPTAPPSPTVTPPSPCDQTVPCTYGCTDITASNYNPSATCNDGSCDYCWYGCTDPNANNYNPSATCDDGSCCVPYFFGECVGCNTIQYYYGDNCGYAGGYQDGSSECSYLCE